MATEKTDFLKFNAYSMKELITRKMSEDSNFTDQIYEGSNLAILIDLVAYMYQVLVYQLNNAASESMFSDTQVYENISRLVKLIGYNPRGFKPSTISLNIYRERGSDEALLQKYSRIDTGLTDSRGEKIYFSTYEPIDLESETTRTITMVNGQWKMYPQVLIASGIPNETFVLDEIYSDSDQKKYVADNYIHIYRWSQANNGGNGGFDSIDDGFVLDKEEILLGVRPSGQEQENRSNIEANRVYNNGSKVFSLRLNENKQYEIKFGDGTTGQKLNKGDQLYIFYLDTNGKDGEIDVGSIQFENIKFDFNPQWFGMRDTDEQFKGIFGKAYKEYLNKFQDQYELSPYSMNASVSKPEQSVDDIKEYAPKWFKMGNRLLTRSDYEFFVKTSIPQVIDVKCMNNWEYLATFYKWLYDCGIKYHQDFKTPARYYFEENHFLRNGVEMIDAADANNIYMWVKTQENFTLADVQRILNSEENIGYLKILTSELYYLSPLPVVFDICACYDDVGRIYAKQGDFESFINQATSDSYIEITIDEDCIYVNSYIINRVVQIFQQYFDQTNLRIGQNINVQEILDEIYSIGGVSRVRTVFVPSGMYQHDTMSMCTPRAVDGISFISWTNGFIEQGEDVAVGNVTRHILDFQFPQFNSSTDSIVNRIKVIKKQLTNMSNIKF